MSKKAKVDNIENVTVTDNTDNVNVESIITPTESPDSPTLSNKITIEQLKQELLSNNNKIFERSTLITVIPYLNHINKQLFIDDIVEACFYTNEHNIMLVDYVKLDFMFNIYVIRDYTNIQLSEDNILDDYDFIMSNSIIDYVTDKVCVNDYTSDISYLRSLIDKTIEQIIKTNNSIENIVNNHLYTLQDNIEVLIGKIPNIDQTFLSKLMDKFSKAVKGLSPEKYAEINKVMQFVKGEDK